MSDSDPVTGHYEESREEDRLITGMGQLELVRTQEVVHRYLKPPPARILDVGGGTGIHAAWLAKEGFDVHVVDLSARHVEKVRDELSSSGITAEVGDARSLDHPADSFDTVLLLGPLYHLTEREDRLQALREARRVVRPGGLVFVAGINRFASLFDGLARGFLFDPEFREIVDRDLDSGQHRNPNNRPHWFTTAYFHDPGELRAELEESGLEVLDLVGVEGLAGWFDQLTDQWATSKGRDAICFAARVVESEPSLMGLSAHLLGVSRSRR
jgi:ubiquinone/menaquinone biosynthesis C-methylase UbiE